MCQVRFLRFFLRGIERPSGGLGSAESQRIQEVSQSHNETGGAGGGLGQGGAGDSIWVELWWLGSDLFQFRVQSA